MNYFFITGASAGLGKALAELLLQDDTNFVYGFSRSCSIVHPNYRHHLLDLSNLNQVDGFQFPILAITDKIVLVNNAGIVGEIKHVGGIDNDKLIETYNINLISPSILSNNFISTYKTNRSEKLIVNISSGAGRAPIDGWNVYCASKAGLDMFSEVLNEEIKIDSSNFEIISLAPGIIDTQMQDEIRKADKVAFSNINRFIDYKKQGDLTHPKITAQQVLRFIQEKELQGNVICSVRDLSN